MNSRKFFISQKGCVLQDEVLYSSSSRFYSREFTLIHGRYKDVNRREVREPGGL